MRPPNLVPLLDVMFVILLFLMLVADFGPRAHEPLHLPQATVTRDCWSGMRGTPLPVNIHHRDDRACPSRPCRVEEHWLITIHGRECTDPTYLRTVIVQELARAHPRSLSVEIRSDAAAPSGFAQRAVDACARLGIPKVYLAARRPTRY